MTTTTIHFVPHTHWDREWYEPFQVFRMRLVDLVDNVLDHLEREPAFRFTLDGQLATIDDYLEVRPGAEAQMRRFVRQGRLAIGPWQILMDEFLVSGETIVRNLQRGWARAEEFGGAMPVGYLPDMFGHVAQMPQILRRAGIGQAVVWRGVPAQVTSNHFRWRSPDGSEVGAEYLVGGYGNAAHLLEVPGDAQAKVRDYRHEMAGWYGDESLLAMYGTDHMAPMPEMVRLLERINAARDDVTVRIETLAEYMASAADRNGHARDAVTIDGELRSGARANMLMGVTSSHMDIKAAAAYAERWLSRYAEPLAALHGAEWPERLLELAWGRVIECSAHDSICGCSVDPVAAQVLVRLGEAEQIARDLTRRTAANVARSIELDSNLWLNPSPHERTGLVELDVPAPDQAADIALELADGRLIGTQEVSPNQILLYEAEGSAADVALFLARRPHGRELFGKRINGFTVVAGTVTLLLDEVAEPAQFDVDGALREIRAAVDAQPGARWKLRLLAAPRRKVCAMVPAPALGWTSGRPVPGTGAVDRPVKVSADSLDNGLVGVRVAADGTLTVRRDGVTITGVGRLVDGGDAGDSYNYAPPSTDVIVDSPTALATAAAGEGPVVGELVIGRTYRWPVGLSADRKTRSSSTVDTNVDMHLEVRAGEPFVRVRLEFDNQSDDHRTRFHIPLDRPADASATEGQYGVVERGLTAEGGHGEVPLPTYPAYGWVDAGGVAVLLDHVTEYEVVEGSELALTCLRSIGMISRNDNPYREEPAGPERPMPAAQMRGHRSIQFALYPHAGSWHKAGVLEAAERYAHEFVVARGTGSAGAAGASGDDGLGITGHGVVMTALVQRDEWLEVRVVAEHPAATEARIGPGIREARNVDLLGRIGDALPVQADSWLRVPLGPWEIRTVQIRR